METNMLTGVKNPVTFLGFEREDTTLKGENVTMVVVNIEGTDCAPSKIFAVKGMVSMIFN